MSDVTSRFVERIIDRSSVREIDIRDSGSCQWSERWSRRTPTERAVDVRLPHVRRRPAVVHTPLREPAMKLRYLVTIGVSVALTAAGTVAAHAAVTPAAATTITVNSGSGASLSD